MTDAVELARAYEAIVQRFVTQARSDATIRAAAVVGSRARSDHPADEWADLDILIWSDDRDRYLDHAAWLAELGDPLITFVEDGPDPRVRERRALFAGGLDVDFAFVDSSGLTATGPPLRDLAQLVLGRGVRILLDPEGIVATILAGMPPQRAARRAEAPDASALERVTADFWYHAVWTAKHLRRGELWWAKGSCDGHLKGLLLSVLEWDAATAGRDPWFRGRYFEEWADPPTVAGLRGAFARYDADELWSALAVTMDLFSRIARRVAGRLAVTYPDAAEGHARALVREYDLGRRGSPAEAHEP